MTTEDDFQRQLDENAANCQLRLIFADWLQDHDDPRADGYRAMGKLELYPVAIRMGIPHQDQVPWTRYPKDGEWDGDWRWLIGSDGNDGLARTWFNEHAPGALIPYPWFERVPKHPTGHYDSAWWRFSRDRHEMENRIAMAFIQLVPGVREPMVEERLQYKTHQQRIAEAIREREEREKLIPGYLKENEESE